MSQSFENAIGEQGAPDEQGAPGEQLKQQTSISHIFWWMDFIESQILFAKNMCTWLCLT